LVNRLVHGEFNEGEYKTEGINITQWPVSLHDGENVRLHIWDFGGQEIMHSTHQFFLTQRSLYLLVLNCRQGHEDADADYWLNLIDSFGEGSPVIIVLKELPFDLNRRALMQKFGFVREFIETDCRDQTGVEELNETILRETDRLEHLRDAFPASWFGIKDRLAGMDANYISYDEYRKICRDNGEGKGSAQESLAFYLHSLGIALNYKDDPRLRDTHVLNPRWVTNGIYRILNAEELASSRP
jgi:internalin A